jgi:hypothetical protein
MTDIEAIALYSGNGENPKYYYQKDKLKNNKFEGLSIGSSAYIVDTAIKDNQLDFYIAINYGKVGIEYPHYIIYTSPLQDNIAYTKQYKNFTYRIIDFRNNLIDNRSFAFDIIDTSTVKNNGFGFAILKNGQRISGENANGIFIRYVELPQNYYDNAAKIHAEIIEYGQKALNEQNTALQVKQQYKQKICSDNVRVNFMDNAEYKAICNEDKYMADIKVRLDKELKKLEARKAQERTARVREMEAMAAQQPAAAAQAHAQAAQHQANAAQWANIFQSAHNMNMNMQMQQLNNNLFLMRMGR